jgi:hypothetical protein
MTYRVLVDDNFHYLDTADRYQSGVFETLEAAIQAAKAIVDEFLVTALRPGMTAAQLFEQYTSFGEDPFIVSADSRSASFSAWDYARRRCDELCPAVPHEK